MYYVEKDGVLVAEVRNQTWTVHGGRYSQAKQFETEEEARQWVLDDIEACSTVAESYAILAPTLVSCNIHRQVVSNCLWKRL